MKKLFSTDAFSRNGFNSISEKTFFGSIAAFVIYGLLSTYFATFFAPAHLTTAMLIGVGLVIPIIGCFVAMNDNLPISFLGYNMITIPFGIVLGPVLNAYAPGVVANATLLTAGITVLMGFAGITYPSLFKSLGGVLFYSLLSLVIVRILGLFIPALNCGLIDYIAAGIFSLYIGYDMYRASVASRSVQSALHISVSLYLDIINLFTTLLSILGNDND